MLLRSVSAISSSPDRISLLDSLSAFRHPYVPSSSKATYSRYFSRNTRAAKSVCRISVVSKWGPLPPIPDASAILLGCYGDSGVCGRNCGFGVTTLRAGWPSGTSLNSRRLRGSSESLLWDFTMGVVLLRQVSIWRRNLVSRSCLDYSVLLDR